jgi:hypothetical protein
MRIAVNLSFVSSMLLLKITVKMLPAAFLSKGKNIHIRINDNSTCETLEKILKNFKKF